MKITSNLFEAYIKCPTKCFLRSLGEQGTGNNYADWVRSHADSYRNNGVKRLLEKYPEECIVRPQNTSNLKRDNWKLAVNLTAGNHHLESTLHLVERTIPKGYGKSVQLIPIRFVYVSNVTRNDKLMLAFDAVALSEIFGDKVSLGKIMHGDAYSTLKINTSALASEVRKLTGQVAALLSSNSAPDLVLNRHCTECEFKSRCSQKAIEKDDLSLLSNMTGKDRKKLHSKGIFTVTQLSYTFRPRRRPKRLRDKKEKYHYSLKALSIRENKIYIIGNPELKIDGTAVYLDVEGLPARNFYYLIGARVVNGDSIVKHSLWADTVEDEHRIWNEFLNILSKIPNPVLIHYGSFESVFIKRMCDRYGRPPEESGV